MAPDLKQILQLGRRRHLVRIRNLDVNQLLERTIARDRGQKRPNLGLPGPNLVTPALYRV